MLIAPVNFAAKMSKQFWIDACKATLGEPPRDLAVSLGAVVSVSLAVSAAASGWMFKRWWMLDAYDRGGVWKHYGWFCGLMCLSCCMGTVSYSAWAQWLSGIYASQRDESAQAMLSFAAALRWLIVYVITYPFNLCCDVVTKLLVVDRLMDFSKLAVTDASRWAFFGRVSIGIVVFGNVVGICGNIAAAVFFSRSAAFQESQETFFGIDETARKNENKKALEALAHGLQIAALHLGFEVIMLLLIVVAVAVVGLASYRRIRDTFVSNESLPEETNFKRNAHGGVVLVALNSKDQILLTQRKLKHQVTITCAAVFISFIMRAAYSTMFTLSNALQRDLSNCSNQDKNRCSDCYEIPYFIASWMLYTPIFFYSIVFISQPVTFMIALWGMTSERLKLILKSSMHQQA